MARVLRQRAELVHGIRSRFRHAAPSDRQRHALEPVEQLLPMPPGRLLHHLALLWGAPSGDPDESCPRSSDRSFLRERFGGSLSGTAAQMLCAMVGLPVLSASHNHPQLMSRYLCCAARLYAEQNPQLVAAASGAGRVRLWWEGDDGCPELTEDMRTASQCALRQAVEVVDLARFVGVRTLSASSVMHSTGSVMHNTAGVMHNTADAMHNTRGDMHTIEELLHLEVAASAATSDAASAVGEVMTAIDAVSSPSHSARSAWDDDFDRADAPPVGPLPPTLQAALIPLLDEAMSMPLPTAPLLEPAPAPGSAPHPLLLLHRESAASTAELLGHAELPVWLGAAVRALLPLSGRLPSAVAVKERICLAAAVAREMNFLLHSATDADCRAQLGFSPRELIGDLTGEDVPLGSGLNSRALKRTGARVLVTPPWQNGPSCSPRRRLPPAARPAVDRRSAALGGGAGMAGRRGSRSYSRA